MFPTTVSDYQKLLAQDSETSLCDQARAHYVSVIQNVDAGGGSSVGLSGTSDDDDDDDDDDNVNDSSNTAEQSQEDDLFEVMSNVSDVSKLISEQKADESLSRAFELAHLNKGGYFLKSDLLFRKSSVLGKEIEQLVVPSTRRKEILELAHSRIGCHMGVRCTKERIALTFTWPSLINDVIKYRRECDVCQKRARVTFRDRVPTEGGVVSVEPVFSHFYVDCLGPIHFTGELTPEFLRRIGCSPIWCTPRHPEANSCERTIGTIKSLIAKVAYQYPKS